MRKLLFLPLFFLLCSCFSTPELDLEPFYEASCTLQSVDEDSVYRFAKKFYDATRGINCSDNPYYQPTVDNIDLALRHFHTTITIDDQWGDTLYYKF